MSNILVIGDVHEPFTHPYYLDFVNDVRRRCKCKIVVQVGDIVDNHALSKYEHHPDGYSPGNEVTMAIEKLKNWQKAFPKMHICIGNHDERIMKTALRSRIPSVILKSYREIFEFPSSWDYQKSYYFYDVKFYHGMGLGGRYPYINGAIKNMKSIVIGHFHTIAGTRYIKVADKTIFGMCVGCGINQENYAFSYSKDTIESPMIGCGVVAEGGKEAFFVPMKNA